MMAYFPNGTSFAYWQEEHCTGCLNYRDNGSGSLGCAITDAHFLHAHEMHDRKGSRTAVFDVLDSLIPDSGEDRFECRMRLTTESLEADEQRRRADSDRARYEQAMAETRAA